MDIYHLPTHKIDDTYLGVEHQHIYPSFPNRLADKIETMKKASDLAMSTSSSVHSLIPRRSSLSRPRSSTSSPVIRPLPNKDIRRLLITHSTQQPQQTSLELDKYARLLESSSSLKRISRAELENLDYNEPLATSFSTFQHSSIGVQAEGLPLLRHDFKDLRETRTWTNDVVDPFLTDLRAAIIKSKPIDLQEYCAAYCNNIVKGCLPPETQGQSNNSNIIPVVIDSARRVSSSSSSSSAGVGREGKKKVKRKETSIIQIRGEGGGIDHPQTDLELLRFRHHQQSHPGQDDDNHNHHHNSYNNNSNHHGSDDSSTHNNNYNHNHDEESQHHSAKNHHAVPEAVNNHCNINNHNTTTEHMMIKRMTDLSLH